ncbi:MFS transporter [Paenibacillus marinisediminis]
MEQSLVKGKSYKDLLTQRQYLKMIGANVVNRFGDSIDMIAFSLMVYQITGSASWVALVFGINALPTILFQPFAGAIVEGLNKKYTMVICDIGRGVVVGLTALLLLAGILSPWILLLLTFINSTLESFRIPAGLAVVPKILDKEYYTHGLSLNSTLSKTIEIVGLAAAGAIIGLFGIGTAILIDAITFFTSAIIILFIRTPAEERKSISIDMKSYINTLADGFAYLKQARVVFAICLLGGLINLALIPISSMSAPYTTGVLGLSSIGMSVGGIGTTAGFGIGAFLYPFLKKHYTGRTLFIFGGAMVGLCYLLWVVIPYINQNEMLTYVLLALSMFLFGLFASFILSVIQVSFMQHIEEAYISRVGAIFNAIANSTAPLGSLLVAGSMIFMSLPQLFAVVGIFTIALFIGMLSIKVLKQL